MKATVLAIAIAVALTAPAGAAANKAKTAAQPAISQAQQTNDASFRLVKDSLPIWLPSWAQPIYQKVKADDQPKPAAKSKKARRAAQR